MSQFPPRAFLRMAAATGRGAAPPARPGAAGTGRPGLPPQAEIRFLSLRDVLGRLTISRSLLYELIRDPVQPFPAPVHIGRRSVWVESEVERYMYAVLETARRKQGN